MTNTSAESLERQAIERAKRGDFGSDARSINEQLTRMAPANEGAWTRLARCCLELGQFDDATAALDAVLQRNPQNTIARNLLKEVSFRRAGPVEAPPRARVRRTSGARSAAGPGEVRVRAGRATSTALAGIGRAEFAGLAHLTPGAAADALTARIEPLLMALNDRPFAAKVTEARNRAGHAGVRLFRRGSLQPGGPGHIYVHQQGGRWEPQLNIGLFAASNWERDALAAGIAFDFTAAGGDDFASRGREGVFQYFETFQRLVASTWRLHLTDWMRANGGFIQLGARPPATTMLPGEAVGVLVAADTAPSVDRVSVGRWLFADRGEDIGILTDGSRLVRWLEATFSDLLPLWGDVYRSGYGR